MTRTFEAGANEENVRAGITYMDHGHDVWPD